MGVRRNILRGRQTFVGIFEIVDTESKEDAGNRRKLLDVSMF